MKRILLFTIIFFISTFYVNAQLFRQIIEQPANGYIVVKVKLFGPTNATINEALSGYGVLVKFPSTNGNLTIDASGSKTGITESSRIADDGNGNTIISYTISGNDWNGVAREYIVGEEIQVLKLNLTSPGLKEFTLEKLEGLEGTASDLSTVPIYYSYIEGSISSDLTDYSNPFYGVGSTGTKVSTLQNNYTTASDLSLSYSYDDAGGLLKILGKSSDGTSKAAGSAGVRIYFNSTNAEYHYTKDFLNTTQGWGTGVATVRDTTFSDPEGRNYNKVVTYTNSSGTATNETWGATDMDMIGLGFKILTPASNPAMIAYIQPKTNSFKNYSSSAYAVSITDPYFIAPTGTTTLPITLTYFSATLQSTGSVLTKWETAMEKNNKEFIVQRSSNGTTFEDVKTIPGAGNSNSPLTYSTMDNYPLTGTSYYRLKQVDFDGTTSYSKIVAVSNNVVSANLSIKSAQPNPFQEKTEISYSLPAASKVTLTLSNFMGNVISTTQVDGKAGGNYYTLGGSGLEDGIYFLNIAYGNESTSFKLVKGTSTNY